MGGEGETARDTRLIDVLSSRRPAICMLTCGYAMTSSLVGLLIPPTQTLPCGRKTSVKSMRCFFHRESAREHGWGTQGMVACATF